MVRFPKGVLDRVGKSIADDWELARDQLRRATRDRKGATFGEVRLFESAPGPMGLVVRTFTGVLTWTSSTTNESRTDFLATPVTAAIADTMSESDFAQLIKMSCHDVPGTPFDPKKS
jgi:hypothetical protein